MGRFKKGSQEAREYMRELRQRRKGKKSEDACLSESTCRQEVESVKDALEEIGEKEFPCVQRGYGKLTNKFGRSKYSR